MKIAKTTLHNEALARIRDMVTEGQLEPGSKISELKLCELFGISRTPVREALKVLANEGMLVLLPNRGARVAQVSAKDLADLFRVVGTLEGLAGELACANIRDEALNEIRALHHEMLAHHARGDRAAYFRLNQAIHDAIFAAARGTFSMTLRGVTAFARRFCEVDSIFVRRARRHEVLNKSMALSTRGSWAPEGRGLLSNAYRREPSDGTERG